MSADLLALLSSLGVPGQMIGYAAMMISVATVLVRSLPRPAGPGAYALGWSVLSWVANLRAPEGAGAGASASAAAGKLSALGLFLSAGLAVSGCSTGGSLTQRSAQLSSDINLIAGGIEAVLPSIEALPNVGAASMNALRSDIATIGLDAKLVAASLAGTSGVPASPIQEIATILGDIASTVLPTIPGGSAFVPVVQAAQALLPELLAAAGVTGAQGGGAVTQPDAARAMLSDQIEMARVRSPH